MFEEPTIYNSFANGISINTFTTRRLLLYFEQFEIKARHCEETSGWNRKALQEMMLYFLMANRGHLLISKEEITPKERDLQSTNIRDELCAIRLVLVEN